MDTLFQLPQDILESVFSLLDLESILSVAYSCKGGHWLASRKSVLSTIILREYNLARIPLDIPDFLYLVYTKCEIMSFSVPIIPQSTLYCLFKHNIERIKNSLGEKKYRRLCCRLPRERGIFLYEKAYELSSTRRHPTTLHRSKNALARKDARRTEFYNSCQLGSTADRVLKLYCGNDFYSSTIRRLASSCSSVSFDMILKRCLKLGTYKNLREVLQLEQVVVTKELLYKSGRSLEAFLLLFEKYEGDWDATPLILKAVKYENVDLIIHLVGTNKTYIECAVRHALVRDWPELLGILEKIVKIPRLEVNLTDQRHSRRYCTSN